MSTEPRQTLPSNTPQKASHRAKNECNARVAPLGLGFFRESGFLYTCRPAGAKNLGSCLIRVHRKLLCDKRRDEVNSDTFEIEGEFTDSHIATEQPFMHTTERA